MKAGTLATVEQVKSWAGVTVSDDDVLLQRLVDGASAFVYSYLSLDTFAKSQYDEMYDGHGGAFMVLRQIPAIEVLAVAVNGLPIQAASGDGRTSALTNGFKLLKQNVVLYGHCFPYSRNSIYVSYTAGYWANGELHTVPDDPGPYGVTVNHTWLADEGVELANGTPLTAVTGDVDGPLQYAVADGVYTFSDDLAAVPVKISYSFVPADVNQAVVELVAERYKYRDRIGHASKSIGGQETVSFQANTVSRFILDLLNKYIRVVPI